MTTRRKPGKSLWNRGREADLPSKSYVLGIGAIAGIGLATFCIHLVHLLTRSEELYVVTLGTLLPMGMSSVVLVVAVWVHRYSTEEMVLRIGTWCVVGVIILIGVSVVSFTYQQAKGFVMADPLFVITNNATVGAILGSLIGIYDSQRHRRGKELREEREYIKGLNNKLTVLNRVLRHDIRNAVNVILGYSENVHGESTDLPLAMEIISKKAHELQRMSEQARQLERILGRDSAPVSTVDIAQILHLKIEELEGEHPEIDFETDLPGSAAVRAPLLVESAVDELLKNAIKHNDADQPRVTVRITSSTDCSQVDGPDLDIVTVQICDNGPGIPTEELEVLERGHETAMKHTSGLGLWLVHWVVDAAGGRVTYKANDPDGSIVEVRLPAVAG